MTQPSHDESSKLVANAFTAHVKATHTTGMFLVDEGMTVLSLSLTEGSQALALMLGGNAVSLDASQALDLLQWLLERRDVILAMTVKASEKDAEEILLQEQKQQDQSGQDKPL
jgi:dsDNA-binding SOS-regulon protein